MSTKPFQFDPMAVAHYEVEGWKAYYDRAWWRLLRLVLALAAAQFHIPFPQSIIAAYHVTRASVAWVPKNHDPNVILHHLVQFYQIARRYSGLAFDAKQVAALELQYWDDHRRLVGQSDKMPFIETMTQLHAAIFGLTEAQTRASAQLRVEANNLLDTITGRTSDNPDRDWQQCEKLLQRCYASLQSQLGA